MASADRTRKRILDAAYQVFNEKGYCAASEADIAARAKISTGTFYRFYRTKLEAFSDIIEELMGAFDSALLDEVPDSSDTLEDYAVQVWRIGEKLLRFYTSHPYSQGAIFYDSLGMDDEAARRVSAAFDVIALYTESYLRHGVRKGFLKADLNVKQTAILVNATMLEIARRLYRESNPEKALGEWMGTAMTIVLDGALAHPASESHY
jgi:AcrR family transcriptional regulator